jgi:hypothetical protein
VTGPAARTRPTARRPPTCFGTRGDEPRRTEFDLQGQYFWYCCAELKSGSDDDGTEPAWASVAGVHHRPPWPLRLRSPARSMSR